MATLLRILADCHRREPCLHMDWREVLQRVRGLSVLAATTNGDSGIVRVRRLGTFYFHRDAHGWHIERHTGGTS